MSFSFCMHVGFADILRQQGTIRFEYGIEIKIVRGKISKQNALMLIDFQFSHFHLFTGGMIFYFNTSTDSLQHQKWKSTKKFSVSIIASD